MTETYCQEYSVFLVSEKKLEELCQDLRKEGNYSIDWNIRVFDKKLSLFLTGNKKDEIKAFSDALADAVGEGLVEEGDKQAVDIFTDYLVSHFLNVSTAESATAGYLGKLLTDKAGSSKWFWGGMQTYSIDAKVSMLKVDSSLIKENGTVSLECATSMAGNINRISGTSVSLSITGAAGPSSDEKENPVGTVCLGFSSGKKSQAVRIKFSNKEREETRLNFALASLILGTLFLKGKNLTQITDCWLYI